MSLINKMLKDLETRERGADSNASAKPMFDDLRSVNVARTRSPQRLVLWGAGVLVAAVSVGSFYFFRSDTVGEKSPEVARIAAESSVVTTERSSAIPEPEALQNQPRAVAAQSLEKSVTKPPAPARAVGSAPKVTPKTPATTARAARAAAVPKAATAPAPTPVAEPPPSGAVVMEKRDRPVVPQEQAEARYRDAALLVSQGRAEDARAILDGALAMFPDHRKARELAAAIAMQNGRLLEAQNLLTQGIKLAPNHLPFSQLLARIYLEQGAGAQAIATLESARGAGSGNADYLSLLAALYQQAGRHADAVRAYRDSIALRATDARAWLGLGISLEATKDAAASEAYTRALQIGGLETRLIQYAHQRLAALNDR